MRKIIVFLVMAFSIIGFAEAKGKDMAVKQEMSPIVRPREVEYLSEGWWIYDDDQMVSFVYIEGDYLESYLFSQMDDRAIKYKIKDLSFCEYKAKEETIELTSSFRRLNENEIEMLKYNIENGEKIGQKECDSAN